MMVYRSIECSNARNSIGNGFPMKKYIGAMVRKSIRVVLVAEKDLLEVASDPDAEQPRRSSQRRLLAVRKINPRSKTVKKNETI